jgi:hypothetical protein
MFLGKQSTETENRVYTELEPYVRTYVRCYYYNYICNY